MGSRNDNGEALFEFCDQFGLIIANSLFQHPSKHITTRLGQLKKKHF